MFNRQKNAHHASHSDSLQQATVKGLSLVFPYTHCMVCLHETRALSLCKHFRNRRCEARCVGRGRAPLCRRRAPAWSVCGGRSASPSAGAREARRPNRRALTNGMPTRRPSGPGPAPSLSSTSDASRFSSHGACRSARKLLRCLG